MPSSSTEIQLIQEALPAYQVGQELGRGAFGIVYQARHSQLGRQVAIKQLGRVFAADPMVRARFVAEAQMVAALDHPHIVPVYDFVDRDDGLCLIIMEQCAGAVSDRFTGQGLATDEACATVLACCAALDFAHAAGVLHRDIKPENLLYDSKGVIKLGDFGIARALDTSARRTATGTVIGTPAYMSPEQVRGEDLTAASDIYSVGIMAYELLSGRFPFSGTNSATSFLAHHLATPPTPLTRNRPELPAGIGEVIDRTLSKDVADRQRSALELATELTRACVAAFGAGWLRNRRFMLHWPEVIAESERSDQGGALSGTIMVRADDSRTQLAGPRGGEQAGAAPPVNPTVAPVAGLPNPPAAPTAPVGHPYAPTGAVPGLAPPGVTPSAPTAAVPGLAPPGVTPSAPTAAVPGLAPPGVTPSAPTAAAPGPVPPVVHPSAPTAAAPGPYQSRPSQAMPQPSMAPGTHNLFAPQGYVSGQQPIPASPATGGGLSKGVLIVIGFAAVFVAAVIGLLIVGLVAGDDTTDPTTAAGGDDGNDGTVAPDQTDSTAFSFPITPVPDVAPPATVESPFAPSPCPIEQERIACVVGVAIDDEGEMIAAYEVFGFIPELEPVDYSLHFYLDTVVAGDERKAGTEVPGGSWRSWDGLLPFTSFGGENGRIGFTQADVEASGARHLCVLVADPDQRAIPGSGNCAPIPYTFDDTVALEQVDRLLGTYAGRCAIGATLIIPEGWQWVDLVENDAAEAARILRPGDVENTSVILEDFIAVGGVLLGDGPLDGDFIVNLGVWRVEGDFTSADSPAAVEAELARADLAFDGVVTQKTFGGRTINTQVVQSDGFEITQYVVPDFGYALILNFFSPNAANWTETSDAIAATLMGC